MVADAIKQEKMKEKEADDGIQCDFDTDDEDGEAAYDAWRLRELTRIKRDREERDQYVLDIAFFFHQRISPCRREREQQELERWHNMTEEERLAELRKNPKIIDNEVDKKSKYKFLQKYYHRGVFFMVRLIFIYEFHSIVLSLSSRIKMKIFTNVTSIKQHWKIISTNLFYRK